MMKIEDFVSGYKKLLDDLKQIEVKRDKLKIEVDEAKINFEELRDSSNRLNKEINELNDKRDEMIYNKGLELINGRINKFWNIVIIVVNSFLVNFFKFPLILGCISSVIISLLEIYLFNLIVAYIAVTIYDRKINSLEFVELTELIKVKSEELKKMLEKVETLEKNYKDILKYYDDSLEEAREKSDEIRLFRNDFLNEIIKENILEDKDQNAIKPRARVLNLEVKGKEK